MSIKITIWDIILRYLSISLHRIILSFKIQLLKIKKKEVLKKWYKIIYKLTENQLNAFSLLIEAQRLNKRRSKLRTNTSSHKYVRACRLHRLK